MKNKYRMQLSYTINWKHTVLKHGRKVLPVTYLSYHHSVEQCPRTPHASALVVPLLLLLNASKPWVFVSSLEFLNSDIMKKELKSSIIRQASSSRLLCNTCLWNSDNKYKQTSHRCAYMHRLYRSHWPYIDHHKHKWLFYVQITSTCSKSSSLIPRYIILEVNVFFL